MKRLCLLLAVVLAFAAGAREYNLDYTDSWEVLGTCSFFDGVNTGRTYSVTVQLNRDNTDIVRIPDAWSAAGSDKPFVIDVSHPYCVVVPEQECAVSALYQTMMDICSMSYYSVYLYDADFEDFLVSLPYYNCEISGTTLRLRDSALLGRFLGIDSDPLAWGYVNDEMNVELGQGFAALDFEQDGLLYHIHSLNSKTVLVNGLTDAATTTVTFPSEVIHNGDTYTVAGINHRAFYGCTNLESVVLPFSVSSIGDNAFSNCTNLTSINLTPWVSLGQGTFKNCPGLTDTTESGLIYRAVNPTSPYVCEVVGFESGELGTNVEIKPKVTIGGTVYTVTSIGEDAFTGASDVESISIPATVSTIHAHAFGSNPKLNRFTVDAANDHYAATADGMLTDKGGTRLVRIPEAAGATVAIPAGIKTLGAGFLYRAEGISEISIPTTVTAIEPYSLCNTSLHRLTLPGSVTTVPSHAITENALLETLVIAEGIRTIESDNLNNNESLRTISIPASLSAWSIQMGNNYSLESITVAEGNPIVCDIDGVLFSADRKDLIRYPCSKASEYEIPEGTERLVAMDHSLLTKVTIPASVTAIDSYCFAYPMKLSGSGTRSFTHMAEINMKNPVPFEISYDVFLTSENYRTYLTYTNAVLNVPAQSLSAYKAPGTGWSNFDNIVGHEFGALTDASAQGAVRVRCTVGTLSVEGDCNSLSVYTLDGRQIYSGPSAHVQVTPGAIYIIVTDGHTHRIIAR